MKIATFNIENLFHRDDHLIRKTISQSVKAWMQELEDLLRKDSRIESDYGRMRELSFLLGFHKAAVEPYVVMRRKGGQHFLQQRETCFDYRASEYTGWSGWIKLASRPIPEIAVQNKAKVISEINPDILVLQEVEDRFALMEFNAQYLPEEVRFEEIVVVPGNNPHGLDLGLMLKNGYRLGSMTTHCNETSRGEKLFDNDFQEYEVKGPAGNVVSIFSAHLCEAGEEKQTSDVRRKRQGSRMAEAYNNLLKRDQNKIVVGTLNAPSYCESISPLLRETDLVEVKKHNSFNVDFDAGIDASYYSLGAYRAGINLKQKDYMLLSPGLFNRVKRAGLNRKGIWPEKKDQFRTYETLNSERHQASSHPLIWGDIDL